MRTHWKMAPLCLALIACTLTLSACSNHYKYQFEVSESNLRDDDASNLQAASEDRAYGYTQKVKQHHANNNMHLSLDTGTKIADMQGVHGAHVIVTDANAYVAIVLDLSATGTLRAGTPHEPIYGTGDGRPFKKDGELKTEIDAPFTTPDEKNVSNKLKQKIALKVRELNPHVSEVFISASDDFNTLLGRYLRLQWSGEELDDYVNEFNAVIEDYFPHTP